MSVAEDIGTMAAAGTGAVVFGRTDGPTLPDGGTGAGACTGVGLGEGRGV